LGGNFFPKKCNFYPKINLQFIPKKVQILTNFPPKNAIFENFLKKCNIGQFTNAETKKYGEIFS